MTIKPLMAKQTISRERLVNWLAVLVILSLGFVWPPAFANTRADELAKSEGRHASLVDRQRPNLFTTSVANIAPHSSITVDIAFLDPTRAADLPLGRAQAPTSALSSTSTPAPLLFLIGALAIAASVALWVIGRRRGRGAWRTIGARSKHGLTTRRARWVAWKAWK